MIAAFRSENLIAPPLILYLDDGPHNISCIEDAARFIRAHSEHRRVAPASLLLHLMGSASSEEMSRRVWQDFATWAFVAGLTKPEVQPSLDSAPEPKVRKRPLPESAAGAARLRNSWWLTP